MDGGKETVLYAEVLQNDFDGCRQSVGGTGSHADDMMRGGIEVFKVDPFQQYGVAICERFAGGTDQYIFCATVQVCLGPGPYSCVAGAIHNQVDAQCRPVR